jgi:rhodanese-related sulfurtransferase
MKAEVRKQKLKTSWALGVWVAVLSFAFCPLSLSFATGIKAEAFDFGRVQMGETATHTFSVKNSGKKTLFFVKAEASCPCLAIKTFPQMVKAGETGTVDIEYRPHRAGNMNYQIILTTEKEQAYVFNYQGRVTEDQSLAVSISAAQKLNPAERVWIDVRSPEKFGQAHISDAFNLPLFAVKTKTYWKTKTVILLDEGVSFTALAAAARNLRQEGFTQVKILQGGIRAWQQQGGILEGTDPTSWAVGVIRPSDVTALDSDQVLWLQSSVSTKSTKKSAYVLDWNSSAAAVKTQLKAHPEIQSIIVVSPQGRDYERIHAALKTMPVPVYFVEGGAAARMAYTQQITQLPKTITRTDSNMPNNTHVVAAAKGCGGCP